MKVETKTYGVTLMVMALLLGLCGWEHNAEAQDLLLASGGMGMTFRASLVGAVNGNPFDHAQVLVRLTPPPLGDSNPYLLVVQGLPEKNSKNTFFWISKDTTMEVMNQTIRCKTKARYVRRRPDIFFFYVSPVLLEPHYITQHEEEDRELAAQLALPTKVFATIGELEATFTGGNVQGWVTMKGYDFVENAYTSYTARFSGSLDEMAEQKLEKYKNIGAHLQDPKED